ncbi:MAG: TatD family hydrolase [Clostridia bacterium]|nr:TatD family hydrolase [Clostridia bacterium]
MYLDIHAHLTGEEYGAAGGLQGLIGRAKAAGVERIVACGYDVDSSFLSMRFSEAHEEIYFCAGFHPSELHKYKEGDFERLKALCAHEKCIGVGEIGLDYHFDDNPPKQTQREAFIEQLKMAHALSLPVVIHSRDAAEETLNILAEHKALLACGGLMHCYSYSAQMLLRFCDLGLYFSFGGTSTFKNAKKVHESVQAVPATRILTETDCPYLTPTPYRGTFPNEPKHIPVILKNLAALRQEKEEELKEQIAKNARTLFVKLR